MKYLRMFETSDERDDVLRDNPYDSILSFTKEAEYGSCISKPIPENEIWYVSQTNDVVEPYATNVFGANIVSNTYVNGKGIIKFDGSVTTIGTRAFNQKYMLTSIIIPQSVTTIGDYAFYATYISKFIFTHNLTSIGGYALANCNQLKSITIPDGISLSLNSTTFLYDMMGSVKIGNGVTVIDGFRNGSFYNININENEETVIRNSALYGSIIGGDFYVKTVKSIGNIFNKNGAMASLNNLVLEDIDEIGSDAFYGVTASNILLKNVKSIGQTAFGYLNYRGLAKPYIEIIGDTNIGYKAFSENGYLGNIVLKPYSNMIIGEEAFSHMYNNNGIDIKEFNIPSGVTQIGKKAFFDNMVKIFTIPDTVQSIGEQAFFTCYGIDCISCDPNNSVYDSRENCNALIETSTNKLIVGSNQTTHIPNTVTSIDTNAFAGCEDLLSIDVPNTITSIGNSAFGGVKNINYHGELEGAPWGALHMNAYLEDGLLYEDDTKTTLLGASIYLSGEIVIPSSVTAIAENAFIRCKNITSITIPNSITTINNNTFSGCVGLTSINIPSSVTTIGNSAFQGCVGLTSITIPNSVTTIGAGAFKGCTGLTNITIPNSVTTIGGNGSYYNTSGAFEGCTGLTSINIPNSVTSIGGAVFKGCTGLTSITIPNSVTSIGASAFSGCTGLTSMTIPNLVTSIGDNTFEGCTGLTSITMPNSVTSIGEKAFKDCTGLTSITDMSSVTSIDNNAFDNCTELTEVNVSSVTTIESSAFYKCKKITSLSFDSIIDFGCDCIGGNTPIETLVLGSSVTNIDSGGSFNKLTSFTCKAVNPPTLYVYTLDYSNNCPIYVPAESVDRYKSATNWRKYASRIQAIPA